MTIRLPLAILILLMPLALAAQARPACAMRPATLAQMRHCYRPLIVFSPNAMDPRLKKQQANMDEAADDMMDRFVLLLPILAKPANYQTPLDTPFVLLNNKERENLRARFHVPEDQFAVLLLSEDGTVKLRSNIPISVDRLNALIDATPDRKAEMQRPHAN
jgi:hypothetical protein